MVVDGLNADSITLTMESLNGSIAVLIQRFFTTQSGGGIDKSAHPNGHKKNPDQDTGWRPVHNSLKNGQIPDNRNLKENGCFGGPRTESTVMLAGYRHEIKDRAPLNTSIRRLSRDSTIGGICYT